MAFVGVQWSFKEELTAAKLNQLAANVTAHDHRADGSQGAALVGSWTTFPGSTLVASSGYSLTAGARYRLLLGGALIEYDLTVTRTGADLTFFGDGASLPGQIADSEILTGIPAGQQALDRQWISVDAGAQALVMTSADRLLITVGGTSGKIATGATISIKGVLCRA